MKRPLRALCVLALSAAPLSAQQEIDNVAAFARLYGVARWFYPSDAAASLDWNRFVVDGVRRVRTAGSPAELEKILEELFTPLGPGIEIGASLPPKRPTGPRDSSLIAWHYRGPAISDNTVPGPYSAKRTNRTVTAPRNQQGTGSGVVMQGIPADTLRGKTIRMRAQVRVDNPAAAGWTGLWLRVDLTGGTVGFFDNMQGRPVRDTSWREYVIEGPVAANAERIVFGALVTAGSMTADVDAIELAVRNADGNWAPLAIPDGSFEAATGGARVWTQTGAFTFTRHASGAVHGAQFVRIAPQRPSDIAAQALTLAAPADSLETPIAGAAIDVELTRGLKARIPLSLTDVEARVVSPALATLRTALAGTANPSNRNDADVRLADAVVAWNVFRHFYPYWGDVAIDWDTRLRPQLADALAAVETREAHFDAVRAVIAELRDGHGGVYDVATRQPLAQLPLQFRILGPQLVVTASSDPNVPVGSVVTAIDGIPAGLRVLRETQLASGTPQWKRSRAERELQTCIMESTVTVTIEPPTGTTRDTRLSCDPSARRAVESRPDSITELQPGIWYVDLTRIRSAQLRPMLDTLSKARGIVFDVRGYPTDAGALVLPHLMTVKEDSTDRWMHVPRFARPFGEVAEWEHHTWYLQPAVPHIGGQRIFLTDGRAISYAESVMGYVRDYKLGTIIGGATAGANGNVAGFMVPGGFSIGFTGMRVTRHDGVTPYHTLGVSPDIPLEPTLAGIRAGRDELLARALAALRIQP